MADSRSYFLHLTPGKLMGLKQITDGNGRFKVLALDQTGVFREAFGQDGSKTLVAKLALTRVVGAHSSSTLLDVVTSARQSIHSGALPKGVGLIVRLEKGCAAGDYGFEETGWNVAKIKRMGASAVKLLVYMDIGDEKYTKAQVEFVRRTYEASVEHDIILMTEELSYPRQNAEEKGDKNSPVYQQRRVQNILEATRLLGPHTDILKLEFPGDDRLPELNAAATRPWVLLSAGVNFDLFEKQVESAMQSGCSGIMAGRAIFKEWLDPKSPHFQKPEFLSGEAVQRLRKLNALVDQYATPWPARYGITVEDLAAAVPPHWYALTATSVTSGY